MSFFPPGGDSANQNSNIISGQCFIPFVISARGTAGINGAVTLDKAAAGIYPCCYMRFADGALWKTGNGNAANNPAGWYFTKFITTTTATVYKDQYVSGKPIIPSSPVSIVQPTAAGAWTPQSLQSFLRVLIPANTLGINGGIHINGYFSTTYETYSSDMRISFGGVEISRLLLSSSNGTRFDIFIGNAGDNKKQTQSQSGGPKFTSIDTTVDQYVEFSGQTTNSSDVIALESFCIESLPFN